MSYLLASYSVVDVRKSVRNNDLARYGYLSLLIV